MRQKKRVLLYCADGNLLSATSFALRLHGFDVTAVYDSKNLLAMAIDQGAAFECGVLIHAQQSDLVGRLVHRILEAPSSMPLLLVDRAGDLAPVRYVDLVLYGRNTTMADILAALELLSRRKASPGSRRPA